jgi:tetraacyldisaccharide 4'-kinase
MKNIILQIWKGDAQWMGRLLYIPLSILSYAYGMCLAVRQQMYKLGLIKIEEVPIPVISVGNITLGGTGKTPVVARLSAGLKKIGFNPGIVTRGYKRQRKGVFCVDAAKDDALSAGDEAFMLAVSTQLPVIVGNNRAAAVVEGMKNCGIDLVLLDDGFQVMNLKKDVEVLVLKGKGTGESEGLFPLGPNREPLARIRDANILLMHSGDLGLRVKEYTEGIPAFRVQYKPAYLYKLKGNLIGRYNFLKGRRVIAFSGLGDNESFFRLLREIGARVIQALEYPDHHVYTQRDMETISSVKGADVIVTTEKDAVKLAGLKVPERLFYLAIEVRIDKEEEFLEVLLNRLRSSLSFQEPATALLRH